ncbi:uncharacterized protein LOC144110896, partial [Amblyomma americanum]
MWIPKSGLRIAARPLRWLLRQLAGAGPEDPEDGPRSLWSLFFDWLAARQMEALLFAYAASAAMPSATIADIFEDQACRRSMGYGEDVCEELADHDEQRYSVYVVSQRHLLLSEGVLTLTSAVVAILAGPVCDRYGHATLLGLAIVGAAGTSLVRVFLALGGGPMLAYVFAVLPMGCSGGHVLMLSCCYYVVTKRTEARLFRTIRFYLLDVSALMGRAVGWLMGWLLHSVLGHQVSLWSALGVQCFMLAVLWASPALRDSTASTTTSKINQLRLLVSPANAREAAKMFSGHRNIQRTLKVLFALQALIAAMNYGPDEILYPYTRLVFGWAYSQYAIVSAIGGLLVGVVGVFAVGCMRVVGVTDVTFMNVGATCGSARDLIIGLTHVPALFYLSYLLAVPQGVAPVGLKSYFSKLVPVDETGKFMALVTACESVFTVLSRVALSFSFDVATAIYVGLPFLLCAALVLPVSVLSGFLNPTPESTSSTSSAPGPGEQLAEGAGGPGEAAGGTAVAAGAPGLTPASPGGVVS